MALVVRSTSDPALALEVGRPLLLAQPEQNTIILSALGESGAEPEGSLYWWACRGHVVVGFAMHFAPRLRAVVAAAEEEVVEALVDTMAVDAPELPGVIAEARTRRRLRRSMGRGPAPPRPTGRGAAAPPGPDGPPP